MTSWWLSRSVAGGGCRMDTFTTLERFDGPHDFVVARPNHGLRTTDHGLRTTDLS